MLADGRFPLAPVTPAEIAQNAAPEPTGLASTGPDPEVVLVVIGGERLGCRIPIGATPLILGRGAGVDFRITDPTVSRHHCVVWRAGGRCWVRDLDSTNCTRVNERVAAMAELREGDVLVVGHTAMTLAIVAAGDARRARDDTPPC